MNILKTEGERFGRYYPLTPPRFHLTTQAWGRVLPRLNHGSGLAGTILTRANQIRTTLRRDPADIIIGCNSNPFDLIAAYLASGFIRLPFVAYLFDDPNYQWEEGHYRRLARLAERIWSRGAAAIIAPNEVHASDVQDRLPQAKFHIVRNAVDPAVFATAGGEAMENKERNPDAGARVRLVYAGSVYSPPPGQRFPESHGRTQRVGGQAYARHHTAQLSSDLVTRDPSSPTFPRILTPRTTLRSNCSKAPTYCSCRSPSILRFPNSSVHPHRQNWENISPRAGRPWSTRRRVLSSPN
jgi:hypothetical protein